MHPLTQNLAAQVATLDIFLAKYRPDGRTVCVHSLDPNQTIPSIAFYAEQDREWIVSTFGVTGWMTDYQSEGWQHIAKTIGGVKVTIHRAYSVDGGKSLPMPVPPSLLTAGHPANDPALIAAAVLSAS